MQKRISLAATFLAAMGWSLTSQAAPLAPNDASVSGSLGLWLNNPTQNFNTTTGVWADSSGSGNDAAPVGAVGADDPSFGSSVARTYVAPTLTTITPPTGTYAGKTLDAVKFTGNVDDLLASPQLNGGSSLSELTIFVVYQTAGTSSTTDRPVGFGSQAAGDAFDNNDSPFPNNFNLAVDGSFRYDNGNNLNAGAPAHPTIAFVRSARLQTNDTVTDRFDGTVNFNESAGGTFGDGGSDAANVEEDRFFIGDVRTGPSAVSGGPFPVGADIYIAEVIVYTTALSDAQVAGIEEYLTTIPEPGSLALLGLGGLMILGGRRKKA